MQQSQFLENTRLFAIVVQTGSFTAAARLTHLPKSTVSRAVRALEDDAGTRLLNRTTRSLSLTAAGRIYFESCAPHLNALEDAQRALGGMDSVVAGTIKLTAPEDLGKFVVAPAVSEMLREWPELVFELNFTNDVVDLVRGGYDLAVRIGKLQQSSFKFRKAGEIRLVLVASKSYLHDHGVPESPAELAGHAALTMGPSIIGAQWSLSCDAHRQTTSRHGRKSVQIDVTPRVLCNQMTTLAALAEAGSGIALLPLYICQEALAAGRLQHVLPMWSQSNFPVSVVSPHSGVSSARVKLCGELLAERIRARLTP
jgi:DNA-binding transcriptional LysR family regulator